MRTEEGVKKSIDYFEKAIAIDPDYTLAYTGLADTYFILTYYGWLSNPEGYIKAKKYALRAIEIDKNLAEAHAALGWLLCWSDWKWEEARKELKIAIELNPNYANAHQYYSELLDILGENKEAREQINMALELDPLSLAMNRNNEIYYYHEGKLKEALEACQRIIEIDPSPSEYWFYYSIYLRSGENVKAVEALQKALPGDTLTIKEVYNKSGINGVINWLIETELNKSKPSSLSLAGSYAWLGKKEEALNWLEKALKENISSFPNINNDLGWDNLRSEPRFKTIIKKMGLSEYAKKE
jgi:tetratricopeptide (TPR) repeat protein